MKTLIRADQRPRQKQSTAQRINAGFRHLAKESRQTVREVRRYSRPSGPLSRLGVRTGT